MAIPAVDEDAAYEFERIAERMRRVNPSEFAEFMKALEMVADAELRSVLVPAPSERVLFQQGVAKGLSDLVKRLRNAEGQLARREEARKANEARQAVRATTPANMRIHT